MLLDSAYRIAADGVSYRTLVVCMQSGRIGGVGQSCHGGVGGWGVNPPTHLAPSPLSGALRPLWARQGVLRSVLAWWAGGYVRARGRALGGRAIGNSARRGREVRSALLAAASGGQRCPLENRSRWPHLTLRDCTTKAGRAHRARRKTVSKNYMTPLARTISIFRLTNHLVEIPKGGLER